MTNGLTFSSAKEGEQLNKQIVEGMGSNLYIQKYGITGGNMKPEELLELRRKIIAARLATARWLNDAMIAEGIDPSKNTKYNKEKIKFLKDVLKERWNKQTKAGTFGNRPPQVQELNRFLRRKRTFPEQLLRFFPGGAKASGKQTQLLISAFAGSDANAFLDETEKILTGIDKVGKTRYSSNVDAKWAQKNLGANLFQLSQGGTNPYYNKDLDTYTTEQYNKEAINAKNKYFKKTPMLAEINPLGYLYNLSSDNPSYAGSTLASPGNPSPLNFNNNNNNRNRLGLYQGDSQDVEFGSQQFVGRGTNVLKDGDITSLSINQLNRDWNGVAPGETLGVMTRGQRKQYKSKLRELGINYPSE
jgi:hypothetical protein